jgi:hypothetical protein
MRMKRKRALPKVIDGATCVVASDRSKKADASKLLDFSKFDGMFQILLGPYGRKKIRSPRNLPSRPLVLYLEACLLQMVLD